MDDKAILKHLNIYPDETSMFGNASGECKFARVVLYNLGLKIILV